MTEIRDHSTGDDDLPLSIVHSRDTIVIDGRVNADYNFLIYTFPDGVVARTYLDNVWEVSITAPMDDAVPKTVMTYLTRRFDCVKQLGGEKGYRVIWGKAL